MKQFLFATLFVFVSTSFSQQFCAAPFKATDIAVSGNNVWIIGESDEKGKGIFFNKGNTWKYYGGMTGEKIYVGKDNKPIVVNNQGLAYQFTGSNWQVLTGRVSEIAVAKNNGVIWSVQGGNIYSYSNGQWIPFQGAQIASQHIDFDQAGTLYSVNTSGYVFKQNGWNWNLMGTKQAKNITIDESGKVWIISKEWAGDGYKIYYWQGNNWVLFNGGAVKMDAGSSAELWRVDNSGTVYRRTGNIWQKKSLDPLNANSSGNTNTGPIDYGDNVAQMDANGEISLFKAAKNNDITGIYTLLGKGANINHLNYKQQNALFPATQLGHDRVVALLAKQNINVNQKDTLGVSPLMNSIKIGDSISVSILLAKGARCNDIPAINYVLAYNRDKKKDAGMITTMLVEKGAIVNHGHLKTAATQNNTETFDALAFHAEKYLHENEVMEIAIKNNNPVIANVCVEHGASAEKGLDLGIKTKNTQLITTSISKGADAKKAITYSIDSKNTSLLDLCLTLKKDQANYAMNHAITKKDTVSMDICLKYGADINTGFTKMVESNDINLIKYGLNKNASPSKGLIPAVKKNNMDVVKLLFAKGAQIQSPEVMANAANNQNREMILFLISKGGLADDGILAALKRNNSEIVQLLFDNGASATGSNVVETAAQYCSKNILDMVLSKGGLAQNGLLPAIKANKLDNTQSCLQYGATATEPKYMEAGVNSGNFDIVKELLKFGANPNDGIKLAVAKANNSILRHLAEKGGSVQNGELFIQPINMNKTDIVQTLVDFGCNLQYKDAKQNNLLHITGLKEKPSIARILIKTGKIDINAKNDVGDLPIHYVVVTKNLELTQIYVEAGADINAKNSMGKVVFKVAKGTKVKKYLKSKGAKKK